MRHSVRCLDNKRLISQKQEALTLLRALERGEGGWHDHPACQMWKGYEEALKVYINCCIRECVIRGFNNSTVLFVMSKKTGISLPWWFCKDSFHSTHRAALLKKDSKFYSQYGWTDEWRGYKWPKGSDHPGKWVKVKDPIKL